MINGYATHQRFLLRAALNTTGPILELGCGWYSTPLLHEVAKVQKRFLLTCDNDPNWAVQFEKLFAHSLHQVEFPVKRSSWEGHNIQLHDHWGLVFVDHGPTADTPLTSKGTLNALDRAQAVLDLMDRTDVFVLHDTEPRVRWEYDWDKVLPLFKYRIDDITHEFQTTILSNTVDVSKW